MFRRSVPPRHRSVRHITNIGHRSTMCTLGGSISSNFSAAQHQHPLRGRLVRFTPFQCYKMHRLSSEMDECEPGDRVLLPRAILTDRSNLNAEIEETQNFRPCDVTPPARVRNDFSCPASRTFEARRVPQHEQHGLHTAGDAGCRGRRRQQRPRAQGARSPPRTRPNRNPNTRPIHQRGSARRRPSWLP